MIKNRVFSSPAELAPLEFQCKPAHAGTGTSSSTLSPSRVGSSGSAGANWGAGVSVLCSEEAVPG